MKEKYNNYTNNYVFFMKKTPIIISLLNIKYLEEIERLYYDKINKGNVNFHEPS